MYEYVPLDDPGCSLTRILRQPSAVGWLLDGKQSQGSTTTEELGLPAHCPGIDEPDPMIPWEKDLPAPGWTRSPRGSDHRGADRAAHP